MKAKPAVIAYVPEPNNQFQSDHMFNSIALAACDEQKRRLENGRIDTGLPAIREGTLFAWFKQMAIAGNA